MSLAGLNIVAHSLDTATQNRGFAHRPTSNPLRFNEAILVKAVVLNDRF